MCANASIPRDAQHQVEGFQTIVANDIAERARLIGRKDPPSTFAIFTRRLTKAAQRCV
jgi:hypothetical protein